MSSVRQTITNPRATMEMTEDAILSIYNHEFKKAKDMLKKEETTKKGVHGLRVRVEIAELPDDRVDYTRFVITNSMKVYQSSISIDDVKLIRNWSIMTRRLQEKILWL